LSGKGQTKLKLSGNGNECKPLMMGVATAPLQPILMRMVHINVALNAGRPPPGWKGMTRFRGW
jgi:hypothetical protein